MKLENVTFCNLRLFDDTLQTIDFCQDKNVTILLGDNGAGKTSLLHGISVVLSQYFEPFPKIPIRQFVDNDIHVTAQNRWADFLQVSLSLAIDTDPGHIKVDMFRRGNESRPKPSYLQSLKEYGLRLKDAIDEEQQIALPILAYYGTERGQITAPERRRDFNNVFSRWDAYENALEPSTNFKRFFTWFERNEDMERREQKERQDWSYRNPVLEVVREALSKLDDHLQNPRVEVSPLRFVMDDTSIRNHPREMRIEMMSDGYRIMIAMVADIAARMAEANPSKDVSGLKNPLHTKGIVLIDEIDLHLHPIWQRKVLQQLHQIFPNIQFIVTTHSPNVVIGSLDIAQVVKLDKGKAETNIQLKNYANYDISLLLLSDLFSMKNVRSDEFKRLEDQLTRLMNKREPLSADEQTEARGLMMQLADFKNVE